MVERSKSSSLTLRGLPIPEDCVAESFGNYFSEKVRINISKANVDQTNVYNGKCKLIVQDRNFMTKNDVKLCMLDLINKKSEGFDRIPVCAMYVTSFSNISYCINCIFQADHLPDHITLAVHPLPPYPPPTQYLASTLFSWHFPRKLGLAETNYVCLFYVK